MAQTIVAMFNDKDHVEAAINELKDLNYDPSTISIVMKDVREAETVEESTGAKVAGGATSGAVLGGVLGGVAGFLVGAGVLTIPGIGPILAAGPIATALGLTGATAATATGAVTGVVAGGLLGALTSLGFSKEDATRYEELVRGGGILVAVPSRDVRTTEVRDIMTRHGATDTRQLDLAAPAQS